MKAAKTFLIALPLSLFGCADMSQILQTGGDVASAAGYGNQAQLVRGIKDALELSSERASSKLSAVGGYSNNSLYRINLPSELETITSNLRRLGLGAQLDNVEALMNRGAEKAAAEAKEVFVTAVRNMSITDAMGIIRGDDTAATRYFRQQTEQTLRQRYRPIIEENLGQIGFYDQYQQFLNAYKQLPLANKPSLDLEQHVLTESLDGLFKEVATQERLIRNDPVSQGSAIIAAVFGDG